MNLLNEIIEKAKQKQGKIILPEALKDARVMEAVKDVLNKKLSNLILFGKKSDYSKEISSNPMVEIIDIDNFAEKESLAEKLYELRKEKGMTLTEAKEKINDELIFSNMLIKTNYATGMVAGAYYTTADVLRPALQIVKAKKGRKTISGSMLLIDNEQKAGRPSFMVFSDVSLVENPTTEQLSEIAISAGEFVEKVIGVEPKIAFLSYSSKGSAKSEMTEKVVNATNLAKSNSSYLIDGEMQFDSAVDSAVAKKKKVDLTVGGQANVFIFPDLNAGNISYKIASRLGGYLAIGPITNNFARPVNDLSRGCTAEEIVYTVAITKLQAEI